MGIVTELIEKTIEDKNKLYLGVLDILDSQIINHLDEYTTMEKEVNAYVKSLYKEKDGKKLFQIDKYQVDKHKQWMAKCLELEKLGKVTAEELGALEIDFNMGSVRETLINEIKDREGEWAGNYEQALEPILTEYSNLVSSIETENIMANNTYRESLRSNNKAYEDLKVKQQKLLTYSDKITDVCATYGITPSDIDESALNITAAQLDKYYDLFNNYLAKEETRSNPVTLIREKAPSEYVQICMVLAVIGLSFTRILSVLSIAFYGYLIYNQLKNKKMVKKYIILSAIAFKIDPLKYGFIDEDTSMLLPEELTPEFINSDERFQKFEELMNAVDEEWNAKNPQNELPALLSEFESVMPEYTKQIKEKLAIILNKKDAIASDLSVMANGCVELFKKLKDSYRCFGNRFNTKSVLSSDFVLGSEDADLMNEQVINIGQGNLIIRPYTRDPKIHEKFLQCLVANALSNIAPGKIEIHIYDPNNSGKIFTPFYDKELKDILFFHMESMQDIIEDLKVYNLETLKEIKGTTIGEYNKQCDELGMVSKPYKLLVILSQPKTIEEDEALNSFFNDSNDGGAYIWVVSDKMTSKNAKIFRTPFEGVKNPIHELINDNWCRTFTEEFITMMKNLKPAGLPWETFIETAVPDDMTWKGNSDDVMELLPGFFNGDPSRPDAYTIGNQGNVHVIGVGGTGAGKSVFLNHLVGTCTKQYSPKMLELWLCDFKGTEFKFYLPSEINPYMLPHIKACLCTSDGDYATSLFKALRNVADHRYDVLKSPNLYHNEVPYYPEGEPPIPNQKGTVGWNRYWRQRASTTGDQRYLDNLWTRILFICDEFQVIFEKADAKNLDSIRADITQIAKVGRAANVHIFFTSQSMKKTLSADILQQFTLRFALRCDKEVSQEILGTTKASDIKEKFGYLYVKATGIANEDQPRYKTPFIADDVLRAHIKKMALKAKEEGCAPNPKDVITYEEVTKHPIQELVDLYKDPETQKKIPDSGVFFLGMRMAYSTNRAPDNIILGPKNNTHLVGLFKNTSDLAMFYNSLIVNIKNNRVPGTIIANSQVEDLSVVLKPELDITNEKYNVMLTDKFTIKQIYDWVNGLYEHRKAKNIKDKPCWIFCFGWDKAKGFGVEPDIAFRAKLNTLLQVCGEYHIHFIFLGTGITGFAANLMSSIAYKVSAKCAQDESFNVLESKIASGQFEMADGWFFIKGLNGINRNKLYISEVRGEVVSTEIVL